MNEIVKHPAVRDVGEPPESYSALAGDYPWLTVAMGLGAGLLAGALLPRRAGSRALGLALGLAEAGLALSAPGAEDRAKPGFKLARGAVRIARGRAAK